MSQAEVKTCEFCDRPIERPANVMPAVWQNTKYHEACYAPAQNRIRRQHRHDSFWNRAKKDPTDYVILAEFARSQHVTLQAVHLWLRRKKKHRKPSFMRWGMTAYIHVEAAAEYAASRAGKRPAGWPTYKSVMADVGESHAFLEQLERDGQLRVQYHQGNRFIHPEDARYAVRAYRDLLPPAGMVQVAVFARDMNRTQKAVLDWARRNKKELRRYRHPDGVHLILYLLARDADLYRDVARARNAQLKQVAWQEAA